jgi:hypothetical protein
VHYIFALLYLLHLPSPPRSIHFPPWQDLFYFPGFGFFLSTYCLFKGFFHSISHMHILHFNQMNIFYYLFFLCHSAPLLFNSFQWISLCYLLTQMQCISILFPLHHSLFLSWLPLVPSRPIIFCLCVLLGFELRAYTLSHSNSSFFVIFFSR